MSHSKATQLPRSIQNIIKQLSNGAGFRPADVINVLKEAQVEATDLAPWSDFNHPKADSYGRKLVYQGANFEILVMSWVPGDFSTIHDHGYTKWGAVQIFGSAEHATFRYDDGLISTLARWKVNPGDVVGVSQALIHQMGNPSETPFLSLHVYGANKNLTNITADARIFDLANDQIQYHNGGVFFDLKPNEVSHSKAGLNGDFATKLRHLVELSKRRLIVAKDNRELHSSAKKAIENTFSIAHRHNLLRDLEQITDKNGHVQNSQQWRILNEELKVAAQLQQTLKSAKAKTDNFFEYANLYDQLIGKPMLDAFMANYLKHFFANYPSTKTPEIISIGCGTGLVEKFLVDEIGVLNQNLLGIDVSEAMITVAKTRINAQIGDVLKLEESQKKYDLAFSGLNVFHYIDYENLESAITQTASVVKPGGWFVGDFITPDHMRWYPNVMYAPDQKIISLRTPRLVEQDGRIFQESEILNLDFTAKPFRINYAGKHKRFLPPMHRIRSYFEKAFGPKVILLDAYTLKTLPQSADTCSSTRYVVFAQKSIS